MLNPYQIMWVLVCYDLPTTTRAYRRAYARFRKFLLNQGFISLQFSIYAISCPSLAEVFKYKRRIQKYKLTAGHVMIMIFTDKQFGMIEHLYGIEGNQTRGADKRPQSLPSLFAFLDENEGGGSLEPPLELGSSA